MVLDLINVRAVVVGVANWSVKSVGCLLGRPLDCYRQHVDIDQIFGGQGPSLTFGVCLCYIVLVMV